MVPARPGASFRLSLVPMVIADDDRRFVAANPAACLLLRLPETEILTRRVDDLTPLANRPHLGALWHSFIQEGTQRGTFELLMPDGPRLEVEYSATAHIEPGRHLSIFLFPPSDVETHVRHCLEKLGARNRAHAIALGLRSGEISLDLELGHR